ncbi:MAG: cytochrome b/b6 domain-containing protein [Mariprofundaceae bacterium]|nr:cytochrome b/b6 domain-containing protein [Mariprofundaceae bacterium]
MNYANPIRVLHSLLALCLLSQIAIGQLMDVPGEHHVEAEVSALSIANEAMADEDHQSNAHAEEESWMFEVHEFLGISIAALIMMRLALAFTNIPGAHWRNLFPWFSKEGRNRLQDEIKSQASGWKQGKLAAPENGESVARSAHGLMLLIVLAMAATGVTLFFGWNEHGQQTEIIHMVGEAHEFIVIFLEAFIVLHILAVVLHMRGGHSIINRIRPFAK